MRLLITLFFSIIIFSCNSSTKYEEVITTNSIVKSTNKIQIVRVHFDHNKYAFTKEFIEEVILNDLKINSNILKMYIEGHTDNTGTEKYNLDLGYKRATTVQAMVSNYYPVSNILLQSFGYSMPVMSNDTEEGRLANRRADVYVEMLETTSVIQSSIIEKEQEVSWKWLLIILAIIILILIIMLVFYIIGIVSPNIFMIKIPLSFIYKVFTAIFMRFGLLRAPFLKLMQLLINYIDKLRKFNRLIKRELCKRGFKDNDNKEKGDYGEAKTKRVLENNKKLENILGGKLKSIPRITDAEDIYKEPLHGIDHIFENMDKSKYEFTIVESKYGTSQLSTKPIDGKQMSLNWIRKRISKYCDPITAEKIMKALRRNKVRFIKSTINEDGSIKLDELNKKAEVVSNLCKNINRKLAFFYRLFKILCPIIK